MRKAGRTPKYYEAHLSDHESPAQAHCCIGAFIDMYNAERPHASLDGLTPNMVYARPSTQAAA